MIGEFRARLGKAFLRAKRLRMRGAEDPPSPLDHVLHDGLGFEQVVACVEIRVTSTPCRFRFKRRSSRVRLGLFVRVIATFCAMFSV